MEILKYENNPYYPVVRVDGEAPTRGDMESVGDGRIQVSVQWVKGGAANIEFLEPIVDSIHRLVIHTIIPDLRFIRNMKNLEDLVCAPARDARVNLDELPKLSTFWGNFRGFPSIVRCRHIEDLELTIPDPAPLTGMQSPIRELDLRVGRRDVAVPLLADTEHLEVLKVYNARSLDLANVAAYPNLKRVSLQRCTALKGATALLSLHNLERVDFEDSVEIDDWPELESLSCAWIRILGKNPFDAEFRAAVESRGNWDISSYLPPPRDSAPVEGFEYFVHPAFPTPKVAIPGQLTLDPDSMPERWDARTEEDQTERLRAFTADVLAWLRAEGATRAVFEVEPYGDSDLVEKVLDNDLVEELLADVRELSGIRFQRDDERLAYIDENVDDGILIHTKHAIRSYPWKLQP